MVFSRGKVRNKPNIIFSQDKLEVVDHYDYLGVTFSYNGTFKLAMKKMYDVASRAMFSVLRKARKLNLDIDTQLKLFEIYGCTHIAVW